MIDTHLFIGDQINGLAVSVKKHQFFKILSQACYRTTLNFIKLDVEIGANFWKFTLISRIFQKNIDLFQIKFIEICWYIFCSRIIIPHEAIGEKLNCQHGIIWKLGFFQEKFQNRVC